MGWCAKSGSSSSCVSEVVVEHAAETTVQDSAAVGCGLIGGWSDKLVSDALTVSLDVIVVDAFVEELPEVSLAQRNDAVQAKFGLLGGNLTLRTPLPRSSRRAWHIRTMDPGGTIPTCCQAAESGFDWKTGLSVISALIACGAL